MSADLSDYDPGSISKIPNTKLAIFIVSTYGEGDPSDNATPFISWLNSNREAGFQALRYAAFGLGNKKYKFYNRVVDVVVEALDRCGATQLMATGKADDSNGTTDEDFTDWKQSLFTMFQNKLGIEEKPQQYQPSLSIVEDTSLESIDLHIGEPAHSFSGKKASAVVSSIEALPIKQTTKLFSTPSRNYLHIELGTDEFPELKYKTGDHLAIWPSNPDTEVQLLAGVLGLEHHLRTPLLITSLDPSTKVKVPSPTTWDSLLQHYLEICAPISRDVVVNLVPFAPDSNSKAALKLLGENRRAYQALFTSQHMTLARLLQHVSTPNTVWSDIPHSFVVESLPALTPRYYSISSSSVVSPKSISITVATSSELSLSHTTPVPGLTTGYLSAIEQQRDKAADAVSSTYNLGGPNNILLHGAKLYAHVRKSKFRLPVLPKTPIIMIASGSGIAPFRGFLTERARLASFGRDVGPSLLFFGCRSPTEFLYEEELMDLEQTNNCVKVTTAFSRTDNVSRDGKCYVQHRLREQDEEVIRLLMQENAYFYICGSAGMARDVAKDLGDCMRSRLGWNDLQLREWSEGMRKTHRWQEDVWG